MATAVWDLGGRRAPRSVDGGRAPGAGDAGLSSRAPRRPALRRRVTLLVAGALAVGALTSLPSALDLVLPDAPAQAPVGNRDVEGQLPPIKAVVAPGDTIWDIAGPHVPEGTDLQSYVAEVILLNDVDPAALEPGSVLDLPQR